MAEKTISLRDVRLREKQGADVRIQPKPMEIADFHDLVKALEASTENEAARIQADLARNQTNLEILATLQALVRKGSGNGVMPKIDMEPITNVLAELREKSHIHPVFAYDFEFTRDVNSGRVMKIRATPVQLTDG